MATPLTGRSRRHRQGSLRLLADAAACRPTERPRPTPRLRSWLACRLAAQAGVQVVPPASAWREPQWTQLARGIACKLLSIDVDRSVVCMLVRVEPGAEYPPHTHAGVEELYLLDGELRIDDCRLCAGDYRSAGPDTADRRVWSESGCTYLLITSTRDALTAAPDRRTARGDAAAQP